MERGNRKNSWKDLKEKIIAALLTKEVEVRGSFAQEEKWWVEE